MFKNMPIILFLFYIKKNVYQKLQLIKKIMKIIKIENLSYSFQNKMKQSIGEIS